MRAPAVTPPRPRPGPAWTLSALTLCLAAVLISACSDDAKNHARTQPQTTKPPHTHRAGPPGPGTDIGIAPLPALPPITPGATFSSASAAWPDPCIEFSRRLPNVSAAQCAQAALTPSTARSVKGMPIFTREVPPTQQGTPVRVLVVGGIHGDELSSASVALHWIHLASDANPVQTPQPIHWRFVPALNPDGLLQRPPRRMNANGVDLNRNFPTPNWERDAPIYWEKRTRRDPRRWPGPKPLSEPETRFLHEQMAAFKPQLIVSIHAPYGVLDFDGPSVPPSRLGRLYLDQVGIFPGSLGHYGGVHKGVPVVTIELPNAQRTPLDSEIRQMWIDLLRWTSERLMTARN